MPDRPAPALDVVRPPVIVIGMHRSGTSFVSRALGDFGVFMGRVLDANEEAIFFWRINRWLLTKSGARWDYPGPVTALLEDPELRASYAQNLAITLRSPLVASYLGPRRYVRHRDITRLPSPWGWKDPRTTLTLPLWLDLFPDARVVHVVRHGMDVAASLLARRDKERARALSLRDRHPRRFAVRAAVGRFGGPTAVHDPASAIDLWSTYVHTARAHTSTMPESRVLEMRYEDLLLDPATGFADIARLAGVEPDKATMDRLCRTANADRAFAYRRDESLSEAASQLAGPLQSVGYTP